MSALDDLLARIEDPQLRADIAREIAPLRAEQELGLVFERHLPEATRLYGHPIRRGLSVQYRADDGGDTWQVVKVVDGQAQLRRTVDGEAHTEQAPAADLVVVRTFGEPIYPGLRSGGRVERGGDKPWHTVINAENYHALETLLYTCEGQVDAIYIDPPYNSGARDWKYNNDYVSAEDGYRHSKWLSFMEKRLRLAKRLLNPDNSVLIVTIDEKEYLRLGMLLGEMFPGAHSQMVSVAINPAAVARGSEFRRSDEYAFFVRMGAAAPQAVPLAGDWVTSKGRTHRGDIRWDLLRRSSSAAARADRPGMFFPFFVKTDGSGVDSIGDAISEDTPRSEVDAPAGTVAVWPIRKDGTEGRWRLGPETARATLEAGYIKLGAVKGESTPIYYLTAGEQAKVADGIYTVTGHDKDGSVLTSTLDTDSRRILPSTQWRVAAHDSTQYGSRLLLELMPDRRFPFPKSLYAVEDALRFFIANKPDALVLDFFSGSGTTAHAVARLNKQDGGRRRSISVSNNEMSPDEAKTLRAAGLVPGDAEWEAQGIFEHITAPRIRAAITGQTPDGEPVKGDYKFTDEFPMSDGFDENVEFFTLTYEDPDVVRAGAAFAAVAPLLWLKAGAQGPRIDSNEGGWALPDGARYGVLFSVDEWPDFTTAVNTAVDGGATVSHAFIVTNSDAQFQQAAAELPPETEPVRLYEDYLTSFTINAGGSL